MSLLRFKMVEAAINHRPSEVKAPASSPTEYFGTKVFGKEAMRRYLNKAIYAQLLDTMQRGTPLSPEIADSVAAGMRQWAMDHGADHYTHWFQAADGRYGRENTMPLPSRTVAAGCSISSPGRCLSSRSPTRSSFPNGGIRNTFEARGYSAWDPTSPAFIVGSTLCIPTVFIAYTGEGAGLQDPAAAFDRSRGQGRHGGLPLLRQGCEPGDPVPRLGAGVLPGRREPLAVRPDLMLTGPHADGHESAKNQQLEDHYFGAIPTRVIAFMTDLEYECLKLGIPVKTRHNEVAPNQFELAPVYEECNLANDHNQLLMTIMDKIARRHNFRVLLHEKPFKGINGSGKHNNWSLGTDTGVNLLSPGKTASENLQFITFLVNVISAVYKHNGLLKAAIMSATNSHRLGANEAPPAIISTFLGTQGVGRAGQAGGEPERCGNPLQCQERLQDERYLAHPDPAAGQHRPQPHFGLCLHGYRFEFRAVGSSDNCAEAMIVLNTAVADELTQFRSRVDAKIESGMRKEKAIYEVLKAMIHESRPIRFDGNGYSDEWREEAARRGLDCETSVPLVFDRYLDFESVDMFARMGVLSKVELEARTEVKWETYTKKIQIEGTCVGRPDDEPHRPDRFALRGAPAGQGLQDLPDRQGA